jgi:hypothetical protein
VADVADEEGARTVPPIDPTKNVLEHVAAAVQRQDDLRNAEAKHVREMMSSEAKHMRELMLLRAELGKQLRDAETARLDAIRAVDASAVQRAGEVQSATAEALRVALGASLEPIQKDIADLRRSQWEAQGQKTQVVETQSKGANINMWIVAAIAAGALFLAYSNRVRIDDNRAVPASTPVVTATPTP